MVSLRRGQRAVLGIVVLLVLLAYLLPFFWMVLNTFKSQIEMFRNPPSLLPKSFSFDSYRAVYQSTSANFAESFGNSVLISLYTMALSLVPAVPCAYGIARLRIRWKNLLLFTFIIGQMLSPSVKLLPLFIQMNDMGLVNTFTSVAISLATFTMPFAILILRPYFLSVPREIEESAYIDGCSRLGSFLRIFVPISYPGIIVAAIFSFLSGWNDLIYPFTMMTSAGKRPLITNIYVFIGEYNTRWDLLLAFAVMAALPVILIFIITQRYIVSGLTFGSVKG